MQFKKSTQLLQLSKPRATEDRGKKIYVYKNVTKMESLLL